MLSWVSGFPHKKGTAQGRDDEETRPYFESETQFGLHDGETEENSNFSVRRMGHLLPKLRRAFETTSISSNIGSFPTAPLEEIALEARDSWSCDQSTTMEDNMSCATGLSYNMSKIDDETIQEACDTVSSPTSETDSFFGTAFRDMVKFGDFTPGEKHSMDDVWLLSSEGKKEDTLDRERPPNSIFKPSTNDFVSSTGKTLPNIRVQTLPPSSQSMSNNIKGNGELEDDEEEIDFLNPYGRPNSITSASTEGDDSYGFHNSYATTNNGSLRTRASLFSNNFRGLWSNKAIDKTRKKKDKFQSRKNRRSKRKSPVHDPLKELSKYHERMALNQKPFSPAKAFKKMGERKNRGQLLPDDISVRAQDFSASNDEESVVSALSTYSISAMDIGDGSLFYASSIGGANISEDRSKGSQSVDGKRSTATLQRSAFRFQSPKNDTPRIVWDNKAPMEEDDEPRVLYTDEGDIAAIIHPKPSKRKKEVAAVYRRQDEDGGFPEDPGEGTFHHLFHCELSTLYEESSSLETSTFATLSHSRSSSSGEAISKAQRSAHRANQKKIMLAKQSIVVTTAASDDTSSSISSSAQSSKEHVCENEAPLQQRPHPHHHTSSVAPLGGKQLLEERNYLNHTNKMNLKTTASVAPAAGAADDIIMDNNDDIDNDIRWEVSPGGSMHQWRQPMALMNMEELSDDYVAEI